MSDVQKSNAMGVTGLVLGIIAMIFFWLPWLAWVLAIPGLIFSIVAMVKKQKYRVGGLILNILAIVIPWIFAADVLGGLAAME